ncbi:hypothetical protein [Nonomuraea dietziae]|uniref:hypothetical protein n=1 Tax=Nonomuraea dietziae TaxID=65515 RepID=UPI0031D4B637
MTLGEVVVGRRTARGTGENVLRFAFTEARLRGVRPARRPRLRNGSPRSSPRTGPSSSA